MEKLLNAQSLDLATHYSLFGEKNIFYLLNGDIQGNESANNGYFIQNQLSNHLCVDFPTDYILKGSIPLNNDEVVLFFSTDTSSEIGVINTAECVYEVVVNDACLAFDAPIRGVYKFTNRTNVRRIYFIDGENPNRYLDLERDPDTGSYVFPLTHEGSLCESCDVTYGETLDCDALRISKLLEIPCVQISQTNRGQLLTGVYQIGVAYGEENIVLSDYYFSQPIKVFSDSSNIGFNLTISCQDNTFNELSVILVSQTRENSLVVYKVGTFPISTGELSITNLENALILDTTSALLKRTLYDQSQLITTNGETLLLGKHRTVEPLKYQPQANDIEVEWQEVKIPRAKAPYYPSFMREEVYSIGIEWFDKWGKSRGVFHIPGRESTEDDLEELPEENDVYESELCDPVTLVKWQVEDTASGASITPPVDCDDCDGRKVSIQGTMSYWEAENLKYPNDEDTWGDLACTPIRHHKMPSHGLTHLHDNFTISTEEQDCVTITVKEGEDEYELEECPPDTTRFDEANCINILAINVKNIEHPKTNGVYDQDIVGYRILVGDRKGNKSILHKGLIYNLWQDTSTPDVKILYPNYPFNDLTPDQFLSITQTVHNPFGVTDPPNWHPPSIYLKDRFTYHSPNIHFQETVQEFGTELKIYGEEIGWIDGKFDPVYKHPNVRLGINDIQSQSYRSTAKQVNSVCHYASFASWSQPFLSRFKIEASQFLLPINQITSDNQKVNNFLRESSYYVALNRDVDNPINPDISRIRYKEVDKTGYHYTDQVDRDGLKNIQGVSYYTGVKIKQPDQYGQLEGIKYRPVSCVFNPDPIFDEDPLFYESGTVYGGDIYITKHSLLRKMPMFTQWLTDVPVSTEIDYREYRNVWYPRFWYDNLSQANDQWNLDNVVYTDLGSDDFLVTKGNMYIFITGVIHYWCESEFIGDAREQDFTINGQYYPRVNYDDIARADKIPFDNKYLYNLSLLNDSVERVYQDLNPAKSDADFITIFSQKDDPQAGGDKWLQFLPLNYTVLPRIYGDFTGIHYTDMYSVMFIFEDQILYSRSDYSVNLNEGGTLLLGQGDIFSSRLLKLSNEATGFVGSMDPQSFINTRYGTYFLDRKRKRFLKWDGKISDVTSNMGSWFQEFISPSNPGWDNSAITVFDNYTEKIYLTDKGGRLKYTLSFSPKIEGFVSFHSFLPDFYIQKANSFCSVQLSESPGVWKHNYLYDYQTYYGTQYPFDVGVVLNSNFKNVDLQSIEVFSEWIKYSGFLSQVQNRDVFFDKVLVYNNQGNTGIMDVLLKDKSNPSLSLIQNSDINSPLICEVTQKEDSIYRLNKLESIISNPLLPTLSWDYSNYTISNVDPNINPLNRSELKGKWFKLHLISDTNHEHKILVQISLSTDSPTFK